MIKKMYATLEFDKVLDMLEEYALCEKAKTKIKNLEPYMSHTEVTRHLNETSEAKLIMENYGTPPLSPMDSLEKSLTLLQKGMILMPEDLENIAKFLTSCRRLKIYLKKAENSFTSVSVYGNSIIDLSEIEDEINKTIRNGHVDDKASSLLNDIRRKIENAGMQVKSKLDSLLKNNKIWFSESFVSIRNGHYTLPVKKEYKSRVTGTVVDVSQSGGTYFIEPSAARKLQEEISVLRIEEENEVRRILYALTAIIDQYLPYIKINIEAMEILDFIFAKAKLSISMKALPLPVYIERKIELFGARHPLLKAQTVIPLDFKIGMGHKGVIITGPNTGGKTVALKTIGLLSLMAQSGLHVPAHDGCFTMNNYVLCDIGDGQSITENLSTFSSHMKNILQILKSADDQSIVLLDELGSGTDPAEGMGLAIAVLDELSAKNCLFVATTHYPEIKEYARNKPGLVNARMAFDLQSLLPLYKLEIGEAGESCALYIAKRLGFSDEMIKKAATYAYGKIDNQQKPEASFDIGTIFDKHDRSNVTENLRPIHTNTMAGDLKSTDTIKRRIKKDPCKVNSTKDYFKKIEFNIGDSVMVYPEKMIGIIYKTANEKGDLGVQLRNKKVLINYKRLKLHVSANKLYPDNYDFSIIFDSVETRKKRHDMERKHDPNLVLENTDPN